LIVGSRFLESLMMVSCRVVAVASSCGNMVVLFLCDKSALVQKGCVEVWHPLRKPANLVVGVLVHQVAYLVSIVICNSFICEVF
jgi:hypothetical protein